MIQRVFLHFLFASIPFLILWVFISPDADEADIVMLMTLCFLTAMVTNLLALPFIQLTFSVLYKSFYNNYNDRSELMRYSNKETFDRKVYELFMNMSSLDEYNSYDHENYNLKADLLIPLLRVNFNMKLINKLGLNRLKQEFNIFPNSVIKSSISRKALKSLYAEINVKEAPPAVINTTEQKVVVQLKDHLNDNILEKEI